MHQGIEADSLVFKNLLSRKSDSDFDSYANNEMLPSLYLIFSAHRWRWTLFSLISSLLILEKW